MLSPEEELALALVLLKNFLQKKCNHAGKPCAIGGILRGDSVEVSARVLEMAKRLEVKKEFMSFMLTMPIMTIQFKEMEEWMKSRVTDELSIPISENTEPSGPKPKKKRTPWENLKKRKRT